MSKYFSSSMTAAEAKREYYKLIFEFHPDRAIITGRDKAECERVCKVINAEYDEGCKRGWREVADDGFRAEDMGSDERTFYADTLTGLTRTPLRVELVGSWLWIFGNTLPWQGYLKELGCHWAKTKQAWCWHVGEYHKPRKRYTMNEVRGLFGSMVLQEEKEVNGVYR